MPSIREHSQAHYSESKPATEYTYGIQSTLYSVTQLAHQPRPQHQHVLHKPPIDAYSDNATSHTLVHNGTGHSFDPCLQRRYKANALVCGDSTLSPMRKQRTTHTTVAMHMAPGDTQYRFTPVTSLKRSTFKVHTYQWARRHRSTHRHAMSDPTHGASVPTPNQHFLD